MTFKEKFNLTDDMSHEEKYNTIIDGLGYEAVKQYIPVNQQDIIDALVKDEHLNNIPLSLWDNAAGFTVNKHSFTNTYEVIDCPRGLRYLCLKSGVNTYSVSELVCILKQCARRWALEKYDNTKE